MNKILTKTESAALATFRIIDDFSAPSFNHSDKDVRIFRTAESLGRKHFSVMTANMLYHFERLASLCIDEFIFGLFCYFVSEFINDVAGMSEIFWFGKFFLARIPKVLTYFGFQFWKFMPCL